MNSPPASALIGALLAQGKSAEAAKEADQGKLLAAKSANELIRLRFALAVARLELASGHFDLSRTQLQSVLQRARTHHLMAIEFESQLSIAELKKKSGQRAAAQTDLLAIEKAAGDKGFGRIANAALSVCGNAGRP